MPEIQLNGKTIATQTGTNEPVLKNNVVMESGFSIPSGVIDSALLSATFPAGHVVQVVQAIKTDYWYSGGVTDTTFYDVPGQDDIGIWSVGITPKFNNSKILLQAMFSYKSNYWGAATRFVRDSTPICLGDQYGSGFPASLGTMWANQDRWVIPVNMTFLDTPSIPSTPVEIVYKIQVTGNVNGIYLGFNQITNESNNSMTMPSIIIAQEISQ